MLLVIATLLLHQFQNIVMHLTLEKQQLQQQLTLKLKKLCLKPTHCPRLLYCQICHLEVPQVLFGLSLHNPSNYGSHVFPNINLVKFMLMTCLF